MVNAIPWEVLMSSTKYVGLSYPTHFLKSRGSVIRNNFLEYRTNKATHFARGNDFNALLAINKAKHTPNRLFLYSCSETIYCKSIKKIEKKSRLKDYHFSISQHFPNIKVVVVQAVIALYILVENKLAPNR